jgi:hypothetical protein
LIAEMAPALAEMPAMTRAAISRPDIAVASLCAEHKREHGNMG